MPLELFYYINFQTYSEVKNFYSDYPYTYHLDTVINFLLYLPHYISVYPAMHPSIHQSILWFNAIQNSACISLTGVYFFDSFLPFEIKFTHSEKQ